MRCRAAARAQQGMNLFGALVVLALAAAGAYYVYQRFNVQEELPSCAALLEGCVQHCSRTATDDDAAEACKRKCEADGKSCEAK
jgi:hypothetical protein